MRFHLSAAFFPTVGSSPCCSITDNKTENGPLPPARAGQEVGVFELSAAVLGLL